MARTNAAAHARFSPDPNAAIGWPPSSPDNLLFASALSHFSVFSFLTAQVLNPSSGRLRQFASYTFALHRSLHPPTFFSSSSTPRLRPSKPRYSHNSSPRPPLLASRRNRKNQVRLQDMFGLTKARTSPRNPDHFPIAQLFLLGQYPATQKNARRPMSNQHQPSYELPSQLPSPQSSPMLSSSSLIMAPPKPKRLSLQASSSLPSLSQRLAQACSGEVSQIA